MHDSIQIADFDINITEVLLVHRQTFVHRFRWSDYRGGRRMDGLVYCQSGEAVFDFGASICTIRPGQMMFLSANSSYTVSCSSMEPFVHYTVNFRVERPDTAEQTAFSEIIGGHVHYVTACGNSNIYLEPFENLLSSWHSKRNGYRVMAKSVLYELLYLYFTDAGRSLRNKDDYNQLLPARRMLDESYMDNVSVAELAALCGLSETHFRRLFLKLFGTTPTEYRLKKRVLRAKDLLLSGLYSVSETAREVGFSDPNYFTRVFRQQTGSSPTDFMKG
ncbi:MAG: helix-turn-helix transcriptional regulator [Clostridia bacterium]|nr:helix-turn-helix transcriptional regulator [Clostridia bacterium]